MTTETPSQTNPRKTRSKWIVGVSMILVAIGGLATWAILSPGALAYYKSPSDIATEGASAMGRTLRVGGRVQDGTLHRHGSSVEFTITDGHHSVPVTFTGDVPDTLKPGTDAIAQGKLSADGTMRADQVQAKCSSKFVPKGRPGDLGKT